MAGLILEITSRGTTNFYRVEKSTLRIGRALDNDVILTDPTLSPYHLAVRQSATGMYEIHPLADENGMFINGKRIDGALPLTQLPQLIEAGRTHIRVMDSSQAVAPTRLIGCRNGGTCLFNRWGWSLALFTLMLFVTAIDNYLSTPFQLSWDTFWHDQLVITITVVIFSLGLFVVNRIASHRWELSAAVSFVSIVLIAAYLLDVLINYVDYYFTASLPGLAISLVWALIAVPFAMGWFLIRLNHGSAATSMVMTVILLAPAAYLQLQDVLSHFDLFDDFSTHASYSDTLVPEDVRLRKTFNVDQYLIHIEKQVSGDESVKLTTKVD